MSHYTIYEIATFVGTAILPTRLRRRGRRAVTRKHTLLITTYVALICALCTVHWVLGCIEETLSLAEVILLSDNPPLELGSHLAFTAMALAPIAVEIIYIILTWLTGGLLVFRRRIWDPLRSHDNGNSWHVLVDVSRPLLVLHR